MVSPLVETKDERKKIVLLIDLDGTAGDWYGQLYNELKKRFPNEKIPTIHELTTYFWEDSFDEKYHKVIEEITESKGFYRGITPYPEAIKALKDIEENCLDFISPWFCSKPSSGYEEYLCHSEKIQWIAEHFGHFWTNKTILTPDKTLVNGNYLIDDHPSIRGVSHNPTWIHLLYDQPYNREVDTKTRFSWNEWEKLRDIMKEYRKWITR